MEVASGQWRQEWAGAAEYGKVVKDGVTLHTARALEVVSASGPGARLRLVRQAYSARTPGTSSYLLHHASRQVFSSGFSNINSLDSPTVKSKPLEISSTPLDMASDSATEAEDYKVSEPDDTDISEPSKWKPRSRIDTRFPSEESSSTDTASIADLSFTTSRNRVNEKKIFRSSFSKPILESTSPLKTPIALSQLKLNSDDNTTNDWFSRRKSYSFEDMPTERGSLSNSDKGTIDSSTDSGICKSSELVDTVNDKLDTRFQLSTLDEEEDSFRNWLKKNRASPVFQYPYQTSLPERQLNNKSPSPKVTLQGVGKVSIKLPVQQYQDSQSKIQSDFSDRRTKKVGFCKTELHFAAESGKVDIIETNEKPAPSTDFRKRKYLLRMADERIKERPITLFETRCDTFESESDFTETNQNILTLNNMNELDIDDEHGSVKKSILKNKIPKPKPYFLGETDNFNNNEKPGANQKYIESVPSVVSLINESLKYCDKNTLNTTQDSLDTNNVGQAPLVRYHEIEQDIKESPSYENIIFPNSGRKMNVTNYAEKQSPTTEMCLKDIGTKKNNERKILVHSSPILQPKAKTRDLRMHELSYFGVDNDNEHKLEKRERRSLSENNRISRVPAIKTYKEDILTRVLGHKSGVVNNIDKKDVILTQDNTRSRVEKKNPLYENLPIKYASIPKPAPRTTISTLSIKTEVPTNGHNSSTSDDNHKSFVLSKDLKIKDNMRHEKKNEQKPVERNEAIKISTSSKTQKIHLVANNDEISDNEHQDNLSKSKDCIEKDTFKFQEWPMMMSIKEAATSYPEKKRNNDTCHIYASRDTVSSENKRKGRSTTRRTDTDKSKHRSRGNTNENLTSKEHQKSRGNKYTSIARESQEVSVSKKENSQHFDSPGTEQGKVCQDTLKDRRNKERSISASRTSMKPEQLDMTRDAIRIRSSSSNSPRMHNGYSKHRREESRDRSKQRKYVLNYDEKDGTLASICKTKRGITTSKEVSNNDKKYARDTKDMKVKNKITKEAKHKTLQMEEQQYRRYKNDNYTYKYPLQRKCVIL